MGKLRALAGREVIRILRAHGWNEVRQKGSHISMQGMANGGPRTVAVPDHGREPLGKGLLLQIMRQTGLPRSLFETD